MRPEGHDRYGKYAQRWPFTDWFRIKYGDHWLHLRGACLKKVHLHKKSFGGMKMAVENRCTLNTGGRLGSVDCSWLKVKNPGSLSKNIFSASHFHMHVFNISVTYLQSVEMNQLKL